MPGINMYTHDVLFIYSNRAVNEHKCNFNSFDIPICVCTLKGVYCVV